ncbi:MAG: hypothetical protein ABIH42_04715, partial [Planctomycetota bacterium]
LLHISEVEKRNEKIEDIIKVNNIVEVKVVKLDSIERKIGLTLVRVLTPEELEAFEQKKLELTQPTVIEKTTEKHEKEPEKVAEPSAPASVLGAQLAALQERRAREAAERENAAQQVEEVEEKTQVEEEPQNSEQSVIEQQEALLEQLEAQADIQAQLKAQAEDDTTEIEQTEIEQEAQSEEQADTALLSQPDIDEVAEDTK